MTVEEVGSRAENNSKGKSSTVAQRLGRSETVLHKGGLALESFQTELGDMAPGKVRFT